MSEKTKMEDLPTFDAAEFLRDEHDMAAYLTAVIEEGDAAEVAHALGTVARARGMAAVAESAGIGREALYKALRSGASPRFDTIARVCRALGVKLVAQPIGG